MDMINDMRRTLSFTGIGGKDNTAAATISTRVEIIVYVGVQDEHRKFHFLYFTQL